jgi:hypothetical protein
MPGGKIEEVATLATLWTPDAVALVFFVGLIHEGNIRVTFDRLDKVAIFIIRKAAFYPNVTPAVRPVCFSPWAVR